MKYRNIDLYLFALSALLASGNTLAQGAKFESKKISLQCGEHEVVIVCGKVFDSSYPNDKRECNRNILTFSNKDGRNYVPSMPKALDKAMTPVSLDCAQGNDGRNYVTVVLSNGPKGCRPCLTYLLFDESGNRLTSDTSDRMQGYGSAAKRLGIRYAEGIFIEGERK